MSRPYFFYSAEARGLEQWGGQTGSWLCWGRGQEEALLYPSQSSAPGCLQHQGAGAEAGTGLGPGLLGLMGRPRYFTSSGPPGEVGPFLTGAPLSES